MSYPLRLQPLTANIPFSQEAEEAIIGAVLVNPDAYLSVASFLRENDFYVLRNQLLWQTFERLYQRGDSIDYVTVQDAVRAAGHLQDIGGPAYLTQLINNTPTSVHAPIYGQLVYRAALRRKYLAAADEIKALALDESVAADTLEADALGKLTRLQSVNVGGIVTVHDALDRHAAQLESAMQAPRALLGIPSALSGLNAILRGYRKQKLYVTAGRPGMGKSSHLFTEAAEACAFGASVAFFTLEMPETEVTNNLLAADVGVEADRLESGELRPEEYARYLQVSARLDRWKLFIDDTASITPEALRLKCLRLKHEYGLDMVCVDYIQLMSGGDARYDTRDQEIGHISRSLKKLAKDLDVPVLAAAQLSREVEKRADKHPQMSDLRESGNIENDADAVLLFYREDYYTPQTVQPPISVTDIGIAKHRGGKTGVVQAGFWRAHKKFVELSQV